MKYCLIQNLDVALRTQLNLCSTHSALQTPSKYLCHHQCHSLQSFQPVPIAPSPTCRYTKALPSVTSKDSLSWARQQGLVCTKKKKNTQKPKKHNPFSSGGQRARVTAQLLVLTGKTFPHPDTYCIMLSASQVALFSLKFESKCWV